MDEHTSDEEQARLMEPITLPLLAVRRVLGNVFVAGVWAGVERGPAAMKECDERADDYLDTLWTTAEQLGWRPRGPY